MGIYSEVAQCIQFYPNLAIQYHPGEFVADRVMAKAVVSAYAGSYTKFSSDSAFQVFDDTMTPEGKANEINFKGTLDSFLAQPYANTTHIDYDAAARNPVAVNLPEQKVGFVARNLKLNKELRTIALAKAATAYKTATASGFSGKAWTDAAALPIKDVQVLRTKLAMAPNTIVMGEDVFILLQNHPGVLGQRPTLRAGSINSAEMAALFGVDQIIVSNLKYNTSGNRGRAQSLGYAWGGVFFMCYREPDDLMSTDSITWASQFLVDNDEVEGPKTSQIMASQEGWIVRAWEEPDRGVAGSLMINAVHKYDLKVVASDLGALLDFTSTT